MINSRIAEYQSLIDSLNVRASRINLLRQNFFTSNVHICSERTRLATESWQETEGEPIHIRRAKLFANICDRIPIAIFDQELIVGQQTQYYRGVGLQLDFNPLVGFEIRGGDRRLRAEQTTGELSVADLARITEDIEYWKGKSPGEIMLDTIHQRMGSTYEDMAQSCNEPYGHFTNYVPDADYEMVLKKGLSGIINDIEYEIAELNYTSPSDGRKLSFLQAAKLTLEAEIRLARRYASLIREKAMEESDIKRKEELFALAEICEYVPENPPRTYWEALQSVRFIHLGLYLEDGNGAGASLCRLDQYLYPFYKADLNSGKLNREQAAELLAAFWIKIAATDRIPPGYVKMAGSGYVQSRIILGGVDRDGQDACNEMTYLILHVGGQMQMDLPMYLRWHPDIDQEIMLKAVWTNAQTGSEPAFHNDSQIIAGLVADGASIEDARDYILHGCSHPFPFGSTYGTVQFINGGKVLELVMYNGYDPSTNKRIGIETGDPATFNSIGDWIEAFFKQWKHMYDIILKGFNIGELTQMQVYSQPFASALKPDCIKKGLGVHEGGNRYNQFTGDIMNKVYADIPDALAAINELVYKQHKLKAEDIVNACANNFDGEEGERIKKMVLATPKYGNDSGDPEKIYRTLNDRVAANAKIHKGYFGYAKRDTRLGGAVHMAHGKAVGALPNGRKSGMPLSDGGISPVAGCDVRGPTVTLRSVAKSLDFDTNRSAVLNQKIPRSLLQTSNEYKQLVNLIDAYFRDFNGYQIQWNIQDREVYIAAKANPSDYKNILVRVGGYSAYFVELDPSLQDQIIARTEQKLN